MTGFTGFQPLPLSSLTEHPQASAGKRHGGPADPRHGQGLVEKPVHYPWMQLRRVKQAPPSGEVTAVTGPSEGYALPAGPWRKSPCPMAGVACL